MFDRTFVAAGFRTSHHTAVHQQPHYAADAARLYGEVQGEAEGKITKVILARLG